MRCRKPDDGFIDLRESEKFLVLPGRRLVAGRASINGAQCCIWEQILEKNPEAAP
jgi:hypothetical protein